MQGGAYFRNGMHYATDVGIECKVPLTWLFTGDEDDKKHFDIVGIYFAVIDELNVADSYSADFDWLLVTDDSALVNIDELEVF